MNKKTAMNVTEYKDEIRRRDEIIATYKHSNAEWLQMKGRLDMLRIWGITL